MTPEGNTRGIDVCYSLPFTSLPRCAYLNKSRSWLWLSCVCALLLQEIVIHAVSCRRIMTRKLPHQVLPHLSVAACICKCTYFQLKSYPRSRQAAAGYHEKSLLRTGLYQDASVSLHVEYPSPLPLVNKWSNFLPCKLGCVFLHKFSVANAWSFAWTFIWTFWVRGTRPALLKVRWGNHPRATCQYYS